MEVVLRFTNLSKNWDQDGIVRRLAEGRRGMFQGSDFREVVACLREVFKKDGIDIKRWDESYGNFQIWKKKVKGLVDRDIPPIITLYDPERVEAHALVVVGYDAEGIEVYDTGDGAVKYLVFHKLEEDSVWRGDILELKKARKHRSLPRFFKKLRRIIKK
jgi:ABC-type bacteriocin/lantibiotic exporter with double-glycine peptidase domain